MQLDEVLATVRTESVDEAMWSVDNDQRARHYQSAGPAFTRARLEDLYDLVRTAVADRDLEPVLGYADRIAEERFTGGFDLSEVQIAFNALEAALWRHVVADSDADHLAESVGLLSTVFGAAKDAMATRYVSLATSRHVPSLDLSAMFRGT